jgi:hypothetical protein
MQSIDLIVGYLPVFSLDQLESEFYPEGVGKACCWSYHCYRKCTTKQLEYGN